MKRTFEEILLDAITFAGLHNKVRRLEDRLRDARNRLEARCKFMAELKLEEPYRRWRAGEELE